MPVANSKSKTVKPVKKGSKKDEPVVMQKMKDTQKAAKGKGKKTNKTPTVKVDPFDEKVGIVHAALEEKNEYGGNQITNMVLAMLKPSLEDVKEDRHPFQDRALEMVSECLTTIAEKLAAVTSEKTAIIESADEVQAGYKQELAQFEAQITQKGEEIEKLREEFEKEEAALAETREEKEKTQSDYEELKRQQEEQQSSIEFVEKGIEETLKPLLAGAPEPGKAGKRILDDFKLLMKKVDSDTTMSIAALAVVKKDLDQRGSFDKLALDETEKAVTGFLANLKDTLSGLNAKEAESLQAIETTTAKEVTASAQFADAQDKLARAKSELNALKKDKKVKEQDCKGHARTVELADTERTEAVKEEEEFDKVLKVFDELKHRTNVVEASIGEEDVDMKDVNDATSQKFEDANSHMDEEEKNKIDALSAGAVFSPEKPVDGVVPAEVVEQVVGEEVEGEVAMDEEDEGGVAAPGAAVDVDGEPVVEDVPVEQQQYTSYEQAPAAAYGVEEQGVAGVVENQQYYVEEGAAASSSAVGSSDDDTMCFPDGAVQEQMFAATIEEKKVENVDGGVVPPQYMEQAQHMNMYQ